ncbi:MAG: hypothetical protein IJW82_05420 [Clostridia bacterium]|nr:hypothetical protein [Clostridia bacterium]
MKWVRSRWLDALLKFVVMYAVFHILFIVSGLVVGSSASMLGFNLLWSHFSDLTWFNYLATLIGSLIIYFIIYYYFSFGKKEK